MSRRLHSRGRDTEESIARRLKRAEAELDYLPKYDYLIVNEDGKLKIEMTVERGRGYVPADKNKKPDDTIGVIPIDSIFSPVKRVNTRYRIRV